MCIIILFIKIVFINVMFNFWFVYLLFYVVVSKRMVCLFKIIVDSLWGVKVRVNYYSWKMIVYCFWYWFFVKIFEDFLKIVWKFGSWKLLWLLFC